MERIAVRSAAVYPMQCRRDDLSACCHAGDENTREPNPLIRAEPRSLWVPAGMGLPWLSAVRRPPAHRRPATTVPRAAGTVVAAGHPQGDNSQLSHPSRRTRRRCPDLPRPRLLPARAPGPPAQEPGTSTRNVLAACLSRMPRRVARTVLRGPRRGNAPEGCRHDREGFPGARRSANPPASAAPASAGAAPGRTDRVRSYGPRSPGTANPVGRNQ